MNSYPGEWTPACATVPECTLGREQTRVSVRHAPGVKTGLFTLAALTIGATGATTEASTTLVRFVPASAALVAACHSTARAVGYPVPCPMKVPEGLAESGHVGPTGCTLHIIGPGGIGGCTKSWRGWVIGSSVTADQHLVLTASPHPVTNYARVVNGPAWYSQARVRLLGWTTVKGKRMREVYVPQGTNDGSSFANHVVLIWTLGGHTYGFGFHDSHGIRSTLA